MCCCEKPTVNGEPGFRWQPDGVSGVYQVNPPSIGEGDELIYDEPGRCGGIDSHCHHYRVVENYGLYLLVRHGGGDDRIGLALHGQQREILANLDSNGRYWMLNAIYHAHWDGEKRGMETVGQRWQVAAAEKRIKTRKCRGYVKVWIEPTRACLV